MYQIYRNGQVEYYERKANEAYWEEWWSLPTPSARPDFKKHHWLIDRTVKRFNAHGSLILEAGCGLSGYVYTLHHSGFRVIGVDFARKALQIAKNTAPELTLSIADVTRLPFPDCCFDGYWSGGVIEHFKAGYDPILEECRRILNPTGIAYISFPYMNYIRKWKGLLGLYRKGPPPDDLEFYQFALDHKRVRRHWEARGFRLLDSLYLSPYERLANISPASARRLLDPLHHHSIMLILTKNV